MPLAVITIPKEVIILKPSMKLTILNSHSMYRKNDFCQVRVTEVI